MSSPAHSLRTSSSVESLPTYTNDSVKYEFMSVPKTTLSQIYSPSIVLSKCVDSDSESEDVAPQYQPRQSRRSRFASLFTRRRSHRTRTTSPPPYVSAQELELIEQRLAQMDAFFGGAAL